jgi:acetyltransferase
MPISAHTASTSAAMPRREPCRTVSAAGTDPASRAAAPTPAAWRLRDGTAVTIRPIRASDLELERTFVRGLSRETRYQRLHSTRDLRPGELERWTNIDPEREAALIATAIIDGSERELGVARYARDDESGDYEFAIVIADAWQGHGLGRKLLSDLLQAAENAKIRVITGIVLSANDAMLGLARTFGFALWQEPGAEFVTQLRKTLGAGDGDVTTPPDARRYGIPA